VPDAPGSAESAQRRYQSPLEISRRVRGSLDLAQVLERLLDAIRTVAAYDATGVSVLNRGGLPVTPDDPRQVIAAMVRRRFDPHPAAHELMLMREGGDRRTRHPERRRRAAPQGRLVECASAAGEHFGLDRLREVLVEHRGSSAGEVLAAVIAATRAFGGGETFPDDLTVMVVRREP
jgi:hypothetical protein